MLSEDVKDIGITKKRVLLETDNVRHVVKLLKVQKGLSQREISESIGFFIGDVLNRGNSLPHKCFEKLQALANGIHESLQVKDIKWRKSYNKDSIDQLARIVGMKKTGVAGKFISEKFEGMNVSSKWQCGKCGRVWNNSPSAVLYREQWCIRCNGKETWTYKQMIELGKRRGLEKTGVEGIFLTSKKEYEGASHPDMAKYQWECGKCGHIWDASANNIKRGSWCRNCQYTLLSRKFRTSYNKIVALAKKVGVIKTGYPGAFLISEEEYYNTRHPNSHKFGWKCGKCSNIFEMDINHVKRPQWCPSCTEGESEIICRGFFERIFNAKFPKARPEWLVNPLTGGQMHLDGYSKKLKLAFEFNGPQHYMFYPKYHREDQDLVKQQARDKIKAELCLKNGISLIVVPHTLNYDEFQDYIIVENSRLIGKEVKKDQKFDWRTFKREKINLTLFF